MRLNRLEDLKLMVQMNIDLYTRKNRFRTEDEPDTPLIDSDTLPLHLCYFVEKCLAFGMKTGSENEDGEFWSVIESIPEYVGGKESLDPVVVEMVQVIGEIGLCDLSGDGKGRKWIRWMMGKDKWAQTFFQWFCSKENEIWRQEWYQSWGLVSCEDSSRVMIALLSCLDDVAFKLNVENVNFEKKTRRPPDKFKDDSIVGRAKNKLTALESIADIITDKVDNYIKEARMCPPERPKSPSGRKHIFHTPLEQLVQSPSHCAYARIDPHVAIPDIFLQCFRQLKKHANEDKLFRTHITQDKLEHVKEEIEHLGTLPPSCNIHVVAAVLIQLCREMPEPLLATPKQEAFLACIEIEDIDIRERNIASLVNELPWAHRPTLVKLLHCMKNLTSSENIAQNGLSIEFLCYSIAPTIFRPRRANDIEQLSTIQSQELRLAAIGSSIMEKLLMHCDAIANSVAKLNASAHKRLDDKLNYIRCVPLQLNTPVDFSIDPYKTQIQTIWKLLAEEYNASNPDKPESDFSDDSKIWQVYGLSNMMSAFPSGGSLYLRCFEFFLQTFPSESKQTLRSRASHDVPENYCVLSIGAKLTCALVDILHLSCASDIQLEKLSTTKYWYLFSDPEFFPKLFSFALLLFEHTWRETLANKDFLDRIFCDLQEQIIYLLSCGPESINDLWRLWLDKRRQEMEVIAASSMSTADSMSGSSSAASGNKLVFSPMNISRPDLDEIYGSHGPLSPIQYNVTKLNQGVTTRLLTPSKIFSGLLADKLEASLPIVSQGNDWALVYSIAQHGASLHTMLTLARRKAPTLMIVQSSCGSIFGAYCASNWHVSPNYYGNGQCFVFSYSRGYTMYPWSQKNDYFMLCSEDSIAVGGGHSFAIYLDANLAQGTSGNCETFDSPCFAKTEDFECTNLEVWSFIPPSLQSRISSM